MRRLVTLMPALAVLFQALLVLALYCESFDPAQAAIRLGISAPPAPVSIFVATTGNDSNAGTLASPFLTIGKAKTAAQTAIAAYQCPTINFRGGTYPVAATLSFGAADSGQSGCTATWRSYPSDNAVWSGGTDLTATFSLCTTADTVCNSGSNGVYQSGPVTLAAFRELYVNGSHRTRARGADAPGGWSITAGGYVSGTDMSAWGNPTNIEIVTASGFPSSATAGGWQQTRCTIASISGTAVTMATPCWTEFVNYSRASYSAWATPWWVENAYELLPTCGAGCWYYNRTTHMLYYHPNGGENMATVSVIAPQTVGLISGAAAHHLTFSRLTLAHSAWNPDVGGDDYVSLQNGFYCTGSQDCSGTARFPGMTVMPAAITLDGSSHDIIFDHNLCTHNGARCLLTKSGAQNVQITANVFTDNGGGPVQLDDGSNPSQANPALQSANLLFQNNRVDGPFEYEDSGNLYVVFARNTTVDHNYFTDSGWVPLAYGFLDATFNTNNAFTNNLIENPCQRFFDCGHIYAATSPINSFTATGNYTHDTNANPLSEFACFYLDQTAVNEQFTGNVCDPRAAASNLAYFQSGSSANTVTGNYTTNANVTDFGSGNVHSGNTTYASGSPPAGAVTIINNAGIQAGVTPGP